MTIKPRSKKRLIEQKYVTQFRDYISSYDEWGQPVSFNYKGEDAYKTSVGGVLSIIFKLVVYSCFVMKFWGLASFTSWSYESQNVLMQEKDLEENISLSQYKNFSIGLQYNTNLFDPTLSKDKYDHYVELLFNCTELVLYNIETQGFGKDRMFGGNKFEKFPDGTPIEYTILDKIKPKLNNYNYMEQLIDLEVLKIKGSSQAFDLIPSVFSAINIIEYPG